MHGAHVRIVRRELVGDGARPVGAAVVHDDDLVIVGDAWQHRGHALDHDRHVALLVVRREERGEARQSRCRSHGRRDLTSAGERVQS